MRVALYMRVSTADQNAGMQLDELRAHCQRRNWSVVEEFLDEGISGSKMSRPALDRLAEGGEAARLRCCPGLSLRSACPQSKVILVDTLCLFDSLGIQFVSLHEGVDTSTPNGRLVFGIFASIAEFERSLIIDRTEVGMQAAKARGARIGRPKTGATASGRCRRCRDLGRQDERSRGSSGLARRASGGC